MTIFKATPTFILFNWVFALGYSYHWAWVCFCLDLYCVYSAKRDKNIKILDN